MRNRVVPAVLLLYIILILHDLFLVSGAVDDDDGGPGYAVEGTRDDISDSHETSSPRGPNHHHHDHSAVDYNVVPPNRRTLNLGYEVVSIIPHDTSSFTQGLTYHDGVLFEGTGLYGRSRLRRIDPQNGSVMKSSGYMASTYFGEGITHYTDRNGRDRIIQITWKSRKGFIYHLLLNQVRSFEFQTTSNEGWGITHDQNGSFIVSDGSAYLHFWDDVTLKEYTKVKVTHNGRDVVNLNELEYVEGRILANVWYSDNIYNIDPTTGNVVQVYDFSSLQRGAGDVLNGISRTDTKGELFVTGKLWPRIYRIRLAEFWGNHSTQQPSMAPSAAPSLRSCVPTPNPSFAPSSACRDDKNKYEPFINLTTKKTCAMVDFLRISEKGAPNPWYGRICRSYAQKIMADGTAQEIGIGSRLVQELCPAACRSTECTCADADSPFAIKETQMTTCASLRNIVVPAERNALCLLDARIASLSSTECLPVHHICPTACGFRDECTCRDAQHLVATPTVKKTTRYCRDASYYPPAVKDIFCDGKKHPVFARSCPIMCGNPSCATKDSTDTLSFYGGLISTSCWLISMGDDAYNTLFCNATEDHMNVKGYLMCPKACAIPSM
mmetsp:Transcript_1978/g.4279  ORF Transcript_1978/g.4279 Transcript_1978/m.4279 type:complete len:609 (+) Transcript_1978:34-1860(+)